MDQREPPEDRSARPAEPRFVADVMLGRLARWLRHLGYDVAYDRGWDDRTIVRIAVRERRAVLSRDRELVGRRALPRALLVESERLADQLRQVLETFRLEVRPERLGRRCGACNGPLEPVEREALAGRVPPFVLRRHDRFRRCRGCGRIYWRGTHDRLFRERLRRMLGDPGARGERS